MCFEFVFPGRTKAHSICRNVIAAAEFSDLMTFLKTNKFSLLIDESTDLSLKKHLCVCARVYKDNKVQAVFLMLIDLYNNQDYDSVITAEKVFGLLLENIFLKGVPEKNLVGFGSDGCNMMMGKYNSMKTRFIERFPGIFIQTCICHSMHLCVSKATKEIPDVEQFLRDVYNYLKDSTKRVHALKEFQNYCETEIHNILKLSDTRWLSLLNVVKRFVEQWDSLQLFFTSE